MFDTICQNIKNDLGALDACINKLRRCKQEGKALYAQYAMSFKITKDGEDWMKRKHNELKVLVD